MVSDLRKAIVVGLALLVTAFTLGSVRVSWTGRPGSADGPEDPGRAAVSRSLDRDLGPGRTSRRFDARLRAGRRQVSTQVRPPPRRARAAPGDAEHQDAAEDFVPRTRSPPAASSRVHPRLLAAPRRRTRRALARRGGCSQACDDRHRMWRLPSSQPAVPEPPRPKSRYGSDGRTHREPTAARAGDRPRKIRTAGDHRSTIRGGRCGPLRMARRPPRLRAQAARKPPRPARPDRLRRVRAEERASPGMYRT